MRKKSNQEPIQIRRQDKQGYRHGNGEAKLTL